MRTPFAESLALIVNDRTLDAHVLLALREDSLSLLDRLRVRLPNILGNTLELRLLDRSAAREAILSPLEQWRKLGLPGLAAEPAEALVTELLDQTDQAALRAGNVGAAAAEAATRGRVETAFLQLALQRLWDVELAAKSPAMRVETLNGKSLDGVRGVVKAHLHEALGQFTNDQRQCLALMFRYLVTPSGGKQANSAVDLFMSLNDEGGKAPSAQALRDILERLAAPDRRILRTQPNVNAPNDGPLFELFHDALAQPVLEWTQRERGAELRLQRDKARRQVRHAGAAIVVLVALLVSTVIAGLIARGSMKEAEARNRAVLLAKSSSLAKEGQDAFDKGFAERSYLIESQSIEMLKANLLSIDTEVEKKLNSSAAAAGAAALEGHEKEITSLAMTSDGSRMITGYEDATAALWNLTKATPVATLLKGHIKAVNSVAISPDGTHAITASEDSTWGWDLAGPAPIGAVLEEKADPARGVAFSDDGKRAIISHVIPMALLWDLSGGTPVKSVLEWKKDEKIDGAAFSPDGKHAMTMSMDQRTSVWRIRDLTDPSPSTVVFEGLFSQIKHWRYSGDGKRLLMSSADTTQVWDLSGSEPVATVLEGEKEPVYDSAFNLDGTRVIIISAHDTTARVWDLTGPKPAATELKGHTKEIGAVWLSKDGKRAITWSSERPSDRSPDSMLVWDLTGLKPVATALEWFDYKAPMMMSPDGTHILTLRGRTARLWDLATLGDPARLPKLAEAQLRRRWENRQSIASKADDPDRPGCLSEAELVELSLIPPPRDHQASSERTAPANTEPACPPRGVPQKETDFLGHILKDLNLGIGWNSAAGGAPSPDGAPPDASVTPKAKGP